MRTDLRFTHLTLVPDQPTRVAIEVVNTADVIDGVTAIIDGLDQDWIHFDEPLVRLFPGASGEVSFTIKVPPECPAGDYLVVVRIVSTISADRQSVQDFWATVDPVEAGTLDVVPQIVTGRTKAQLRTTVSNTGNTPTTFRLDVVDAAGEIDCQVDPREVRIDPAMRQDAIVRMRGPRPWFGGVVSRSILLKAATDEVELTAVATFNQKPRISRGLITFLTLAAIVALWATMFVFVIGFIRNQEVPGKATATAIDGGEQEIPIGKIAASAGGTVTSSTLGEGVPGVAVQAFRVKAQSNPDLAQGFRMQADGELELELAAEAATGDDGVFLLGSLLPGSYQLKFKGAGFSEQWYPGVTSQSEAEVISFAPLGEELGLDIELVGDAGAFSGVIDQSGSGGAPGNFKVTATLIPPNPDPDNPPEPIEGTVNPDGTYELGDLPAPNDYLVQIEDLDGNFATEQFVISVAAGEVKQLNPIVPSASAGKLGGLVVDGAGLPLGGVAVTLRNGDFVLEAVTPTTGDTGSFLFIGLPTPATYIVTFSLEGFTGQTIALELGPGAVDESLRASLIGGLGTINGNVRDQLGNPLGATAVLVEGNGFSAATAALTDAGSTGGVGSFFVSGIPVPGSYTVTFELDGYESVSIPALFGANGGSLSPNVTLTPIAGRVEGVVTSSAGGAVADVAVLLSNGIAGDDRSTVTASAPAGTFSFTGVAPGAYTVRFSAPGFVPYVRLVTVDLGSTVNADVTLRAIEVPPPFVPSPSFTVASTVSSRVVAAPGTLTYTITVANTGNVGLSGVTVSNSLAGAATLVSGDDNSNSIIETDEVWVYSATYTVTQAMIDAGADLVNTTRVATSEVTTPVVATATTTITPSASFTVASTVSSRVVAAPGTLTYTITVANTGNVGLSGVTVSNSLAGAATLVSGDDNSNSIIETDEVWVYSATYTVTQAMIDAGADLVNTTRVATSEVTTPVVATATTTITQNPAVTVSSTVRPPGGYYAGVGGQTLTFEIIVDNDGNVGLSGVTVSNDLAGAATLVSGDANSNSIIETDEVWVYEATYSVTGSDFEAAAVVNTVSVVTAQVPGPTTASATAPNLGSVPSGSVP